MKIEIFYLAGCPNHQPTVKRVNKLIQDLDVTAEVSEVAVADSASALTYRFPGSPTVHVNGVDVEPAARTSTGFGLACRTYRDGPVQEGIPPTSLIREALKPVEDSFQDQSPDRSCPGRVRQGRDHEDGEAPVPGRETVAWVRLVASGASYKDGQASPG